MILGAKNDVSHYQNREKAAFLDFKYSLVRQKISVTTLCV